MAANAPPYSPSLKSTRPRGASSAEGMVWLPEAALAAYLAAQRQGRAAEALAQRPRYVRRLARRLLSPLWRVSGNAVATDVLAPAPWDLLLRAVLSELRPDGVLGLGDLGDAQGQQAGPWRPVLALAVHQAWIEPSLTGALRGGLADAAPAERLCALWGVGPSTVYRAIDAGRRRLAQRLAQAMDDGEALLRRQLALQAELRRQLAPALMGLPQAQALAAPAWPGRLTDWHREQALRALAAEDGAAALWHLGHAGDAAGLFACLQRHAPVLARRPDTDALLRRLGALPLDTGARVSLALAQAALARVRGDDDGERQGCELAVRQAAASSPEGPVGPDRALLLGRAYGALGRYHETRDKDRALACFQESADFLRQAGLPDSAGAADGALLDEFVNTLVRLAWWHVLRNDPRARTLLDRAQALQDAQPRADDSQALLAQAWGEYWRRNGDLQQALECKYRALQIYERLGDQTAVLKTCGNLALLHGEARDLPRAQAYSQRVFDMARRMHVEPETLAATQLNLGAAHHWMNRWDQAIDHYQQGLSIAQSAGLRLLVGRAHYNLAESCYKRFQALGDADDERRGDAHAAASLAVWQAEGDPVPTEATQRLKQEVLGQPVDTVDRLLPGELAAHFPEWMAVSRQRAALALPLSPEAQVAAHLEIARAYLAVGMQEREAALALIERHALGERFAAALQGLHGTFDRALHREQRLGALWRQRAADLLDDAARGALLGQLLGEPGLLSKRLAAELCAVSPATASKLLGQLAGRGLLVQQGRGPSTRYRLPDDVVAAGG